MQLLLVFLTFVNGESWKVCSKIIGTRLDDIVHSLKYLEIERFSPQELQVSFFKNFFGFINFNSVFML